MTRLTRNVFNPSALGNLQVRLLRLVEEGEDRETWVQEILALMEPLARQSPAVATLLAANASTFCHLLSKPDGPLSLSLGTFLSSPDEDCST